MSPAISPCSFPSPAIMPRNETPSFTAGAKRALVDRIEWKIIPDSATAANALRTGEVDWWEIPLPDLIPQLKADKNVVVERLDPYGLYPVLRPNHAIAPTNNVGAAPRDAGGYQSRGGDAVLHGRRRQQL